MSAEGREDPEEAPAVPGGAQRLDGSNLDQWVEEWAAGYVSTTRATDLLFFHA